MEFPPSNRRTCLRSLIIVTQVKMGDERKYLFGYARNISCSGIFVHTITPKKIGEEFNIEFSLPKTDIIVRCRCKVVWSRSFTESTSEKYPGMGLIFLDIDPGLADKINDWVVRQLEAEKERE